MARPSLILRLAARNLELNARRSALVGSLILVAVVVAVIGGSLFDSTLAGLKRTFIDSFTADLFVSPNDSRPLSLFGVNTPVIGAFAKIPTMVDYEKVLRIVERQPGVASAVSQVSGYALLQTRGASLPVVLFGVNGGAYFKTFPDLRVVDGAPLETGVAGVMISKAQAAEIGGSQAKPLAPGDLIKLTAFTSRGFTIRQVPLAGIFEFPTTNAVLDKIAYVDSGTLRSLTGMVQGSGTPANLPSSDTSYLTGSLTDVFGSSTSTVNDGASGISLSSVVSSLADTAARNAAASPAKGAWNFILVRLQAGANPGVVQGALERQFEAAHLPVTVGDWKAAAGTGAALSGALAIAFDSGLVLLAVVIIFVLVNTMTIWITERTGEIGTIRALGGSRGLVFELLFTESMILSAASALAGLVVGSAIVAWMARHGFPIHNRILELVFGGSRLKPLLTAKTLATGFIGALAIGALGVIFPLRLALKVQPGRAMDTE